MFTETLPLLLTTTTNHELNYLNPGADWRCLRKLCPCSCRHDVPRFVGLGLNPELNPKALIRHDLPRSRV